MILAGSAIPMAMEVMQEGKGILQRPTRMILVSGVAAKNKHIIMIGGIETREEREIEIFKNMKEKKIIMNKETTKTIVSAIKIMEFTKITRMQTVMEI